MIYTHSISRVCVAPIMTTPHSKLMVFFMIHIVQGSIWLCASQWEMVLQCNDISLVLARCFHRMTQDMLADINTISALVKLVCPHKGKVKAVVSLQAANVFVGKVICQSSFISNMFQQSIVYSKLSGNTNSHILFTSTRPRIIIQLLVEERIHMYHKHLCCALSHDPSTCINVAFVSSLTIYVI